MLSSREAKELIKLGRKAVLCAIRGRELIVPSGLKERFNQKRGAFTTLLTFPNKELRGCVGIPVPLYPLWLSVVRSSVSSALRDPRFPPLREEELSETVWELSLLTEPEELSKEDIPESIDPGIEGLIVEKGDIRGILLPQVASKYGWSAVEFLENTCLKAGLSKDCWKEKNVKVYKFRSYVFEEVEPWGEVKRIEFQRCG